MVLCFYLLPIIFTSDKDPDKLGALADKLYDVLHKGKMLGKACKRRSAVLKTVFRLLDLESPKLLLKIARLILAVSSIRTAVMSVC